ncbi:MAG: fibronectin type III domain-containing protein, partial [Kiritimatiellae bacterium]|nr:fibronectin type III domain-containing protein [Kiritimatiellia bacterium]
MNFNRRGFILGGAAAAAAGCATARPQAAVENAKSTQAGPSKEISSDPYKGTKGVPLKVGFPSLQSAGSESMGISWAVSGLSRGEVEYADNPELKNSKIAKSGGYGLAPIDISSLQVRLTGLVPGKKYYYRTITTPFTDYSNIYNAKLGEPVVSATYSFRTLGKSNRGKFSMICDTHGKWKSYEMRAKYLK